MPKMVMSAVATMALLVALAAPPARAATPVDAAGSAALRPPSADEQRAFAEGLRLYGAGDARGAERAWKAGYAVAHDPAFLVRIAEAQEKAGAPQEAVQSYRQYLRESPRASDREDIEARLHRLDPTAGATPARGPDGSDEEAPRAMAMPGGGAAAGAGAPSAALPVPAPAGTAGATTSPHAGPAVGTVPDAVQEREDQLQDLMPLVEEEPPRSRLNTAAWIGTGVTTLLLGVAAFYGASAAEKSGDANRLLTYSDKNTGVPQEYASQSSQYEEDVRVGRRDNRLATGFLIAAGVTAVSSALLFILDGSTARSGDAAHQVRAGQAPTPASRRRRPDVALAPRDEAGGAGARLSLCWRF